jgi:hypothetical protein
MSINPLKRFNGHAEIARCLPAICPVLHEPRSRGMSEYVWRYLARHREAK